MATRKKKAKSKPRAKAKTAAKKPKSKSKSKSPAKTKKPQVFNDASTQQIAIAEIVGDIEERMALDRLSE
ncbi:MAG: hypothetical protein Q8L48_41425 [Archangium sp.]|nr:hypothetical protein [Archangium sp.]